MSSSQIAPGLARKVKKVLEIKVDANGDVATGLRTLSAFYSENSAGNRRALRSNIERRAIALSSDFLSSADETIHALDKVQRSLDDLSTSCSRIFETVSSSRAPVAEVLSETEQLSRELRASETRLKEVEAFLEAYQLSPEDLRALRDQPVGDTFFRALERISAIHSNCRALLRTEHQRAGLELMDAMSKHQEVAYERLCRWVQEQCRALGDSDGSDVHPLLQTATRFLRERPILFRYCAEEVTSARHSSLFHKFISALTKGGPGGTPKPIEIHAGDPKRYVGDILAWIHQSIASERDLLVSLFGDEHDDHDSGHTDGERPHANPTHAASNGHASTSGRAPPGAPGSDLPSVASMLDRVFEAVSRPLKVRVEQVLLSSPPLLLAFELQSLLRFYRGTMTAILGTESALGNSMLALCMTSERVCKEQLRAHGERMSRKAGGPSADLSPPPEVSETVQLMVDLVHEASLGVVTSGSTEGWEMVQPQDGGGADGGEPGRTGATFLEVLWTSVVEPVIGMCERLAAQIPSDSPAHGGAPGASPGAQDAKQLNRFQMLRQAGVRAAVAAQLAAVHVLDGGESRRSIFLINCYSSLHGALSLRSSLKPWTDPLGVRLETEVSSLVQREASVLLETGGLIKVLARLEEGATAATLGPDLPHAKVAAALRTLSSRVANPDAMPEYREIEVPRLRALVAGGVGRSVVQGYERVYALVKEPGFEADAAASVVQTPGQMRVILGVQ